MKHVLKLILAAMTAVSLFIGCAAQEGSSVSPAPEVQTDTAGQSESAGPIQSTPAHVAADATEICSNGFPPRLKWP